jgi:FMN phosphatase YigB (HAD superfamily)
LIVNTFLPYADYPTIKNVVPDLLERFSTKEGYRLYPDVERFFLALKQKRRAEVSTKAKYKVQTLQQRNADEAYQSSLLKWMNQWDRVVVGVITNSDNRVANVLDSFGLDVGPARFGSETKLSCDDLHDIDFVHTSYDAWREKPHPAMFHAASRLLTSSGLNLSDFDKVHVGDDYAKDVVGAGEAGWDSILLHREEETTLQLRINELWQFPTDRGKVHRISTLYGLSNWDPVRPKVQTGYYSRWAVRRHKGEFYWESRI